MADIHWTPKMVAVYLEEAADTLKRLPPVKVRGFFTTWPPMVRDFWDAYGWEEERPRLGPPRAAAIDQMDATMLWLRWLEPEDAKLVWARACERPWKVIAHQYGIDRTTAWRRWTYAMVTIAARLNAVEARKADPCNAVATPKRATSPPGFASMAK
ncbi:MAG: DUF6362 family protein [Rhodospirillales bacterium]|nr:DUF6362 family protein [Rhodospirillales bacterium]